ncbi:MAG TPA: DinB family protein [Edaphobacter sp.]
MDYEIGVLFLKASSEKLGAMTGFLASCLNRLSDEQVWQRRSVHENTVGNLVLHLCGNARQWIMHGVGEATDVRVRDEEFSAEGGLGPAELLRTFEQTMQEARAVIDSLPPERLLDRTVPQGREVTKLEAIHQVVGHVQQHVGQIILLTKQICGTDLDLTIPRPR